jgi:hypothetical protein
VLEGIAMTPNFTQIDVPGSIFTLGYGSNNKGDVVGEYFNAGPGGSGGFEYHDGTVTTCAYPLLDINNAGSLLGSAGTDAIVSSHGSQETVSVPGAIVTHGLDLNDRGQVVGYFFYGTGLEHGYLYSRGSYTVLDVPGAMSTQAWGLNNRDEIVGTYLDSASREHGFFYDKGIFTTIDVPGSPDTHPLAINSAGVIVGYYLDSGFHEHGFVDDKGQITTIDVPGANDTEIHGIGDNGLLSGFYRQGADVHGFLFG